MKFKDFIKPTKRKLIIFLVIAILANLPFIGYFKITTGCPPPILCTNFANIFNPVLNPVFFLFGGQDDIPIATYSYSGIGEIYYALMILNIIYWYILSCVIILIYNKIKKPKAKPKTKK